MDWTLQLKGSFEGSSDWTRLSKRGKKGGRGEKSFEQRTIS